MPELPEVEILARHLAPLLAGRTIRAVDVRRARVLAPTSVGELERALLGARFLSLTRRGKFLRFQLRPRGGRAPFGLLGHLGMTGRMFLQPASRPLPKHAAVVLRLDRSTFVFEDPRQFGRLTLDLGALTRLGPEPLAKHFSPAYFAVALQRSRQAIKVKLLDQALVAGVGNIYASEALFRAGVAPRRPASRLPLPQVNALHRAVRRVLAEAIACGSTLPLDFAGTGRRDGHFYYGRAEGTPDYYAERLMVYDRAGEACRVCATPIRRCVQAARSTFYCPRCQRG